MERFAVPAGSRPHDVAPAPDGTVWYTAQAVGRLGRLDPSTGDVVEYEFGSGSRPHGVIVGPDGAPWITDGGLNAIVRVDPDTNEVTTYPLPATHPSMNLNTAVFTADGTPTMYERIEKTSAAYTDCPLTKRWWPQTMNPKTAIATELNATKL